MRMMQKTIFLIKSWPQQVHNKLALLAVVALIFLQHIKTLPGWGTYVLGLVLTLKFWIIWRNDLGKKAVDVHKLMQFTLILLTAIIVTAIWFQFGTLIGHDPSITLLVMMLGLKLLEMRQPRDVFIVIFLAFFVQLTVFFYNQQMSVAALSLVTTWGLFTILLNSEYHKLVPSWKQRLWVTARIMLLAFPLSCTFFIFFPRLNTPIWGLSAERNMGSTGLSTQMSPGSISRLSLSDSVVFNVKFDKTPPPPAQRYWRGPVFSSFDGNAWQKYNGQLPVGQVRVNERSKLNYEVTAEPQDHRWIMALDLALKQPILELQPTGNDIYQSSEFTLTSNLSLNQRLRYKAESYMEYKISPELPAASLEPWLELPVSFNPRTLALATQIQNQIIAENGMPPGIETTLAQAVLNRFSTQGYTYTLSPPLSKGKHTVDEFLFDYKQGFCEHFSSAFAVLMRAMDVPTRVVTGYAGGEINPINQIMTVRQADAHAWNEIYVRGQGWLRIDPTAAVSPTRINLGINAALPSRQSGNFIAQALGYPIWGSSSYLLLSEIRWRWEALQNVWNQTILNWNQTRQFSLLKSLGIETPSHAHLIQAFTMLFILGIGIISLITLRRWRPNLKAHTQAEKFYLYACNKLSALGLPRAENEGPLEYYLRVRPLLCDRHSVLFKEITESFIQLVYAQPSINHQATHPERPLSLVWPTIRIGSKVKKIPTLHSTKKFILSVRQFKPKLGKKLVSVAILTLGLAIFTSLNLAVSNAYAASGQLEPSKGEKDESELTQQVNRKALKGQNKKISVIPSQISSNKVEATASKPSVTEADQEITAALPYIYRPEVNQFIKSLVMTNGLNEDYLNFLFRQAKYLPSVTRLLKNNKTAVRKWPAYRDRVIDPKRIMAGKQFMVQYQSALDQAENKYGVPAEIITAILGVESIYGKNKGSFLVFDALTTLAFDYPLPPYTLDDATGLHPGLLETNEKHAAKAIQRTAFFQQELREFILLCLEQKVDPFSIYGSYAGAIGAPQFMPSSYRRFAVDFNEDGIVDLRSNIIDSIGSVANFLKQHGWQVLLPTIISAKISQQAGVLVDGGLEPLLNWDTIQDKGIVLEDTSIKEKYPLLKVGLIDLPDGPQRTEYGLVDYRLVEYRLASPNFFVLTQYNRSYFYAMSVIELANQLKQ